MKSRTSPQRKGPFSCSALSWFWQRLKQAVISVMLSSHLSMSSSVFWKISHSDLNVFLASLPRHEFLIGKASIIFSNFY